MVTINTKKSHMQETLNLLTDADSSTNTKTDRNETFFFGRGVDQIKKY